VLIALGSRYFTRPPRAQAGPGRILITEPIDETRLVKLAGNTRLEANPSNDRAAYRTPWRWITCCCN